MKPRACSHSTSFSNATSVPGRRHTATFGSPTAAKPPVIELLNFVDTSLSPTFAGRDLSIPLISNEPVNIGEKRLFTQELAEVFHERPQSRLLHGWNELVMHAALTEQGMCSSL